MLYPPLYSATGCSGLIPLLWAKTAVNQKFHGVTISHTAFIQNHNLPQRATVVTISSVRTLPYLHHLHIIEGRHWLEFNNTTHIVLCKILSPEMHLIKKVDAGMLSKCIYLIIKKYI